MGFFLAHFEDGPVQLVFVESNAFLGGELCTVHPSNVTLVDVKYV